METKHFGIVEELILLWLDRIVLKRAVFSVTLRFVPGYFVPCHFVPVISSLGHFVRRHIIPGHFVPWSFCPNGHFVAWSFCPHFVAWSFITWTKYYDY
jgi:hypothetical protein